MTGILPEEKRKESPLSSAREETRVVDAEALLRDAFQADPRKGCSLLYRLYYVALCSHAIRFVYSRQIAEDLVADVFCRFWDDRIFCRIKTSYRAYLFKSVRHRCYNYLKCQLSRKSQPFSYEPEHGVPDPCDILQYDELYQLLDRTINELPGQCRRVFLLSRMENKRYHEIAAELKVSVKAIEAHISKALRILSKKVNEHFSWE
jgi:RNA polymerase sigma-70 factor (family 1)